MRNVQLQRPTRFAAAVILGGLLIAGTSVNAQDKQTKEKNREEKVYKRDLDRELDKLDQAGENLKKLSAKDWKQQQEDISKSLKKIDIEKSMATAEEALKNVDFDQIQRKIESAFEAANSRTEITKEQREEIRREIEKARSEHNRDMKRANEQLKRDLNKARKEIAEATQKAASMEKFDFKKTFDNAEASIAKAKVELKGYQEMIYAMEAEGLLSTQGDYSISWNKGTLSINDKEQPKSTADKYSKYFRQDKVTLKKEGKKFITTND